MMPSSPNQQLVVDTSASAAATAKSSIPTGAAPQEEDDSRLCRIERRIDQLLSKDKSVTPGGKVLVY